MDTAQTILDRILKNSAAITADAKLLKAQLPAPTPIPPPVTNPYPKAITDRIVRPKPAPIALGLAGFSWTEPTFGTKMWRVTDANSNGGSPLRAPSNIGGACNSDGSKFFVVDAGLGVHFYGWDGAKATPLSATIRGQAEPWFSCVDPNVVHGNALNPATGSYRLIKRFNISTGTETVAADLDAMYGDKGLADGGYIGPCVVFDNDGLVIVFGGYGQDSHFLVHHSQYGLIDARTLVAQSTAGPFTGFTLHGIGVDRIGRLILNPSGASIAAHPGLAQSHLYNPATKTITPITKQGFGHYTLGYGQMVNEDADVKRQWWRRSLDDLATVTGLVGTVPTPTIRAISEHAAWRNTKPGQQLPVLSSLFREYNPDPSVVPEPWGVWDDEIIGVSTDDSGTVYRFCHHHAVQTGDYWDQPIAHIDPTGRYVIFTSNWGKTLGTWVDHGDGDKVKPRQDVFLASIA